MEPRFFAAFLRRIVLLAGFYESMRGGVGRILRRVGSILTVTVCGAVTRLELLEKFAVGF